LSLARSNVPGLAARRLAVRALDAVLQKRRPLEETIERDPELASLEPRDRAFALTLARLSCRRLGQILVTLEERLERGMPQRAGAFEAIVVVGAAQLLFMDVPDHAAVDLAIRLCREDRDAERFAGLANAVLRGIARDKRPAAGPEANLPEWIGERWSRTYGDAVTLAMAQAMAQAPPLDLTAKAEPGKWAERLGATRLATGTLRIAEPSGPVTGLPGFEDGAWWVQDAAALLPVLVLGDVRRKRVLDLCAAPGGKTAALAARGAKVTAVDRSPERMARVGQNLDRLKLSADLVVRDAAEVELDGTFDAVLLDAPCSATGTLRRHPDVLWVKRASDIPALAALQTRLLERAGHFVAPGGRLVYCTCSLEPEEGEAQVDAFLARKPEFVRVPVTADEIGGLAETVTAQGDLRTRPDMLADRGGIDGFFVARLERR
jgi:16S rRNA (cytosine967-C5)-methyltransferase